MTHLCQNWSQVSILWLFCRKLLIPLLHETNKFLEVVFQDSLVVFTKSVSHSNGHTSLLKMRSGEEAATDHQGHISSMLDCGYCMCRNSQSRPKHAQATDHLDPRVCDRRASEMTGKGGFESVLVLESPRSSCCRGFSETVLTDQHISTVQA